MMVLYPLSGAAPATSATDGHSTSVSQSLIDCNGCDANSSSSSDTCCNDSDGGGAAGGGGGGEEAIARATLVSHTKSHPFQDRHLSLQQPQKIGRTSANLTASTNALFNVPVLSKDHALLWFEDGKFYLQDTKSSNGTYVNDKLLGKNKMGSQPFQVTSGDVVQFGVDVMGDSKNGTYRCIMAHLKLYLPGGKEAKVDRTSVATVKSGLVCSVQLWDIYTLRQRMQESMKRENALAQKLSTLQQLLDSCKLAVQSSWSAMVDEDHLMTRLETLEAQNTLFLKKFGEDKAREEMVHLMEEKEGYQNAAKESLKRVIMDKYAAVNKLKEMELRLSSMDSDRQLEEQLRRVADESLVQLTEQHDQVVSRLQQQLQQAAEQQQQLQQRQSSDDQLQLQQQQQEACQRQTVIDELRQQNEQLKQQLENVTKDDGHQHTTASAAAAADNKEQDDDDAEDDEEVEGEEEDDDIVSADSLSAGDEQCADLLTVPGVIKRQLAQVVSRLSRARQQHQEAAALLPRLEDELVASEKECKTRSELVQHLDSLLKESDSELSELQREVVTQEDRLIDAQQNLSRLDSDIAEDSTDTDYSEQYQLRINNIQDGLSEVRRQCVESEARFERRSTQMDEARDAAQRAEQQRASLGNRVSEASGRLRRAAARVCRLQRHVLTLQQCEQQLAARFSGFSQQLAHAQLDAVAKDKLIDSVTERAECAERHLSEVILTRDAASATNQQLDQLVQQLQQQLLDSQQQLSLLTSQRTQQQQQQQCVQISTATMTEGEVSLCNCDHSQLVGGIGALSPTQQVRRRPTSSMPASDVCPRPSEPATVACSKSSSVDVFSSYSFLAVTALVIALFIAFLFINS